MRLTPLYYAKVFLMVLNHQENSLSNLKWEVKTISQLQKPSGVMGSSKIVLLAL